MIKRIFHKSKASSANSSTQATANNASTNTNQPNLNVNQSTDQSILLRLKLQFENVVSLKHKQDHVATEPVTQTSSESTDQIDENQKTMTSSDGQLLLEQYNQLNKQSETSIATKLNDLYNKQQELDEKLDDSQQQDDEINSVLFKLPETSHSTNKIILTTDTGNDFNLSRRQSISMATTIEYPLRARILRHLSSSNAAQANNTGISCSSSSCSLFNKSSSSLYSSTACLCMANSSIASSTSNLPKQQTVINSNQRNNLLNIDMDNSRRQSWGSYTHLNQNSKHTANNQTTHIHHPKCPILTTRKQSTISTTYLHPNYNTSTQIVLQSSSSTSSTSSLLSTSHSSQSKSKLAQQNPKLLIPSTYRTSRMNSINSLNHFHKNMARKDSEIVASTNLFKFKNDKLGSSAPNLFVSSSVIIDTLILLENS